MSSNKKISRKAKILPQFSIYSGNKPPLDLLEIQRKSFCDLLERGIIDELSKTDTFRETAKFSGFTQQLELVFNPDTYKLVSPNCTPKEAILKGKTYACKLYVQATLTIRFSPRGSAYSVREGREIEKQPSPFSLASTYTEGVQGAKLIEDKRRMHVHNEKNSIHLVETTKQPKAALSTPLPFKYSEKSLRYLQLLQPAQPTVSWTQGSRSMERLPIASNKIHCAKKSIRIVNDIKRQSQNGTLHRCIFDAPDVSLLKVNRVNVTKKKGLPMLCIDSAPPQMQRISPSFSIQKKKIKRSTTTFIGSPIIKKVVVRIENKIIDKTVFAPLVHCHQIFDLKRQPLHLLSCAPKMQRRFDSTSKSDLYGWKNNRSLWPWETDQWGYLPSIVAGTKVPMQSAASNFARIENSKVQIDSFIDSRLFTSSGLLLSPYLPMHVQNNAGAKTNKNPTKFTLCTWGYPSNFPGPLRLGTPRPKVQRKMHTQEVQEKTALSARKKKAFSFVDSYASFASLPLVETPAVWNAPVGEGSFVDTKFFEKKKNNKWNRVKKYPVLATPLSCIKSSTSFHFVPGHQVSNHIKRADSKSEKQFVWTESTKQVKLTRQNQASFFPVHYITREADIEDASRERHLCALHLGCQHKKSWCETTLVRAFKFVSANDVNIICNEPPFSPISNTLAYNVQRTFFAPTGHAKVQRRFTTWDCIRAPKMQEVNSKQAARSKFETSCKEDASRRGKVDALCTVRRTELGLSEGAEKLGAKPDTKFTSLICRLPKAALAPPVHKQISDSTSHFAIAGGNKINFTGGSEVDSCTYGVNSTNNTGTLAVNSDEAVTQRVKIFRPWIFLGELPLMTKRGHFILNGSPRVIVNQMARCPGIYFQEKRRGVGFEQEVRVSADLIPQRGPWLRIQSDWEGRFWARLKREGRVKYATLYEAFQEFEKKYNAPLVSLVTNSSSAFPKSEILAFQERKVKEDRQKKALVRFFKNSTRYSLGKQGRLRINQRVHSSQPESYGCRKQTQYRLRLPKPTFESNISSYAPSCNIKEVIAKRGNHLQRTYTAGASSETSLPPGGTVSLIAKNNDASLLKNYNQLLRRFAIPPLSTNQIHSVNEQNAHQKYNRLDWLYVQLMKKSSLLSIMDPRLPFSTPLFSFATHIPSVHNGEVSSMANNFDASFLCNRICAPKVQVVNSVQRCMKIGQTSLVNNSGTNGLVADEMHAPNTIKEEHLLKNKGKKPEVVFLEQPWIHDRQYWVSARKDSEELHKFWSSFFSTRSPFQRLTNLLCIENVRQFISLKKPNSNAIFALNSNSNLLGKLTAIHCISDAPYNQICAPKVQKANTKRRAIAIACPEGAKKMHPEGAKKMHDEINKQSESKPRAALLQDALDSLFFLSRAPIGANKSTDNLSPVQSMEYHRKNSVDDTEHLLMAADVNAIHLCLERLLEGQGFTDDIDHLKNRLVRTSGKLLQQQLELGLDRLSEVMTPLLGNLIQGQLLSSLLPSQDKEKSFLHQRKLGVSKKANDAEKMHKKKKARREKKSNDPEGLATAADSMQKLHFLKPIVSHASHQPSTESGKSKLQQVKTIGNQLYGSTELVKNQKQVSEAYASLPVKSLEKPKFAEKKSSAKKIDIHFSTENSEKEKQLKNCAPPVQSPASEISPQVPSSKVSVMDNRRFGYPQTEGATSSPQENSARRGSSLQQTPFRWLRTSKPVNNAFREFFGSNPLSQYMDQTNPLAEITHKRRLSSMGPGGIKRETAGMEVRGIHPTHYGRVCPIETPEGKNAGLVNSPTVYSRIGKNGFMETPLYQVVESQVQKERWAFFSAQQEEIEESSLATGDTGVTRFNFLSHVPIPVQTANNPLAHFQQVERNRVGYKALSPVQTISIATALIPFLEHDDANRALMGSNMQRQAIPLLSPERPIVGTGFEPIVMSESGQAIQATKMGCVSHVSADKIILESIHSTCEAPPTVPSRKVTNQVTGGYSRIQNGDSISNIYCKFFYTREKYNSVWWNRTVFTRCLEPPFLFKVGISTQNKVVLSCAPQVQKRFDSKPSVGGNLMLRFFSQCTMHLWCKGGETSEVHQFPQPFACETNPKGTKKVHNKTEFFAGAFHQPLSDFYKGVIKPEVQIRFLQSKSGEIGEKNNKIGDLMKLVDDNDIYNQLILENEQTNSFLQMALVLYHRRRTAGFSGALEMQLSLRSAWKMHNQRCRQRFRLLQSMGNCIFDFPLVAKRKCISSAPTQKKVDRQCTMHNIHASGGETCNNKDVIGLPAKLAKVHRSEIPEQALFVLGGWQKQTTFIRDVTRAQIYFGAPAVQRSLINFWSFLKLFCETRKNSRGFKVGNYLVSESDYVECRLPCTSGAQATLWHVKNSSWNSFLDSFTKSPYFQLCWRNITDDFLHSHSKFQLGASSLHNALAKLCTRVEDTCVTDTRITDISDPSYAPTGRRGASALAPQVEVHQLDTVPRRGKEGGKKMDVVIAIACPEGAKKMHPEGAKKMHSRRLCTFDAEQNLHISKKLGLRTATNLHLCSTQSAFLFKKVEQSLQLYQRSNQETCLSQRPLVREGDWVQKGDFLADCSASHSGDLALGKNVTVAYMPWEGYNFEDAIVISDRLVANDIYTSIHIERYEIKVSKNSQGKERITNQIPSLSSQHLKHLDSSGIARVSSWVQPGDILVGKVVELKRPLSPYERLAWELASRLSPNSPEREKWLSKVWLEDISLRLPAGVCGRVINFQIISTEWSEKEHSLIPLEVHVYLAVKRKIQVGDKLAGRHGNKGIVSIVLPRQDMPYLADGSSVDMVLNPLGVPSRMNLGQIFECLLGLAGSQLGCNFKVTPFDEIAGGEASRSLVFLKLYQCRLIYKQQWLFTPTFPGKNKLFDGRTGEPFENWVTVGQAYMLKLIHMVDHKIHARSTGPYSLFTRQPVRGRSRRGGQRLGEMEVWAVEGFGAAYTLQEFLTIKSDDLKARAALQRSFYKKNDVTLGKVHISPGNPEAFRVLVSELQALCLHIQM